MANQSKNRTMGGAVGVFFLSWLCTVVGINVGLAVTTGTYGSRGGLVATAVGVIMAVVWKKTDLHTFYAALIPFVIGGALIGILGMVGFSAQHGTGADTQPEPAAQSTSSSAAASSASSDGASGASTSEDREYFNQLYYHPADLVKTEQAKEYVGDRTAEWVGKGEGLDRISFGRNMGGEWSPSGDGTSIALGSEAAYEILRVAVLQMAGESPETCEKAIKSLVDNARVLPYNTADAADATADLSSYEGLAALVSRFEVGGEDYYLFAMGWYENSAFDRFSASVVGSG